MCDVQSLQVSTGIKHDLRGQAQTVTQYSYFIQGHGPFTDEFMDGQDTTEAVRAAQQARYDKLVAVGAISPDNS